MKKRHAIAVTVTALITTARFSAAQSEDRRIDRGAWYATVKVDPMTDETKWGAVATGVLKDGDSWRGSVEIGTNFLMVSPCNGTPRTVFLLGDYKKPKIQSGDTVDVQFRWDSEPASKVVRVTGGAGSESVGIWLRQLDQSFVSMASVHRTLLVQFAFGGEVSRYRFSMNGFAELFKMCRSGMKIR